MSKSSAAVAPAERHFGCDETVGVLLPLPLPDAYDYTVSAAFPVQEGDFVEVPLGRRTVVGVVWKPGTCDIESTRLREIRRRLDVPPMAPVTRRFVEWVADYTVQPMGAVLRMAMSVPAALVPPQPVVGYRTCDTEGTARLTAGRQRVLTVAAAGPPRPIMELARDAAVSPGVIRAMACAGLLQAMPLSGAPELDQPDWRRPGLPLSPQQSAVAAGMRRDCARDGFSVTLLDGVPGSGKTEVYFEAIAETLSRGRQVLVLLPEIALSAQWLDRFHRRFGCAPGMWHSELSPARRRHTWRSVAGGETSVIVGARSALFLPFRDLGLIVIDEEHDASFKQYDGVAYHARDMAIVRARLGNIACILVSATPSLESVVNAQRGRYCHVHLPDRHAGVTPPSIQIVDLCHDRPPRGGFLAPSLRHALATTATAGEQSLLFLNRRGYAPLTLCRACGHRLGCPSCSAWLVAHRLIGRLICHHCGYAVPLPERCPACHAADELAACGPGVERLAEEVCGLFPTLRIAVATSDTLTGPGAAAELVRRIETHEVDLIIGTQIIAKGYHFPLITLVGVVDADLGLTGGDLRAAERTFQLLYQVAGRAGRAERPGRVLLQTSMPQHPVMRALTSGDRDRFLAAEEAARRDSAMPPFGRLAALIISGRDEAAVERAARHLASAAPRVERTWVLGPTPTPLALLRGRHRRRLLVHAARDVNVSTFIRRWLAPLDLPSSVRVQVDIDPISFL